MQHRLKLHLTFLQVPNKMFAWYVPSNVKFMKFLLLKSTKIIISFWQVLHYNNQHYFPPSHAGNILIFYPDKKPHLFLLLGPQLTTFMTLCAFPSLDVPLLAFLRLCGNYVVIAKNHITSPSALKCFTLSRNPEWLQNSVFKKFPLRVWSNQRKRSRVWCFFYFGYYELNGN